MIWLLLLLCLPAQAESEYVWDVDKAESVRVDVDRDDDRVRIRNQETGEYSYGRVNNGSGYLRDINGRTYRAEIQSNGDIRIRKF